jgi:hypothetical protein
MVVAQQHVLRKPNQKHVLGLSFPHFSLNFNQ